MTTTSAAPKVVEAGPLDVGLLAGLQELCFAPAAAQDEPPWSASAIAELLALPGGFALLAELERKPAGYLMARWLPDDCEVLSLGVVPSLRRRGIARALFLELVARAEAAGRHRVILEVAADNEGAQGFYRAIGFVVDGRRPAYYRRAGGAADALLLSRRLAARTQPLDGG